MSAPEVRSLAPAQWRTLRAARLAALADSPQSFGSSVDEEAGWGAERWRSQFEEARWAVAEQAGHPMALLGVRPAPDTPDCDCWISSVWVAPSLRGGGVVRALVDWVDGVCRSEGWQRQGLGVWVENVSAQRAFSRLGFTQVGAARSSTHFPGRHYVRMLRTVPERAD